MPPKKKKPTPIVVGTVSTRSTRRESIVNIEIIPKANKPVAKAPASKNTPKKSNTPHTSPHKKAVDEEKTTELEKTKPEILEILKDWSDDENSQDNSFFSKDIAGSFTENKNKLNFSSVSVDQQSLIDILEGNHLEPQHSKTKNTLQHEHRRQSLQNPKNTAFTKDNFTENPIVNIYSPKIDDSEIIEECVVEDDSIIIELPEVQMEGNPQSCIGKNQIRELNVSVENLSVRYKLDSPTVKRQSKPVVLESDNCSSDNTEQKSNKKHTTSNKKKNQLDIEQEEKRNMQRVVSGILKEDKQPAGDPDEKERLSTYRIDEECRSVTSEDTTSQSMITVQDEDACDNDMHISDNSTNQYEVIEEQVEFDTSEPIIIDNLENIQTEFQTEKKIFLKNESAFSLQKVQNTEYQTKGEKITSSNNPLDDLRKSRDTSEKNYYKNKIQGFSSGVSDLSDNIPKMHEITDIVTNDTLLKIDQACKDTVLPTQLPVTERGPKKKFLQSITELSRPIVTQKLIHKSPVILDNVSKEKVDEDSVQIVKAQCSTIEDRDIVEAIHISHQQKKERHQNVQITESDKVVRNKIHGLQVEKHLLDNQSEENTLCQKISKFMDISEDISNDSNNLKVFDPASDRLQEGIEKMHIEEKTDLTEIIFKGSDNIGTQKINLNNMEVIKKLTKPENYQTITIEEKEKTLTPKTIVESQTREGTLDSHIENCYSKEVIFEREAKQKGKSTRKKIVGDDSQSLGIDRQEDFPRVHNISNIKPLNYQINFSGKNSFQDERLDKQLEFKNKKIDRKEGIEVNRTDKDPIVPEAELDANKITDVKEKPSKELEAYTSHVIKMDIDSESSEAKTSEAEGDSTSNESSQSSNSTNLFKQKAQKIFTKKVQELEKMEVESNLKMGMNKSDFDINITTEDNSQKVKSKVTKTKPKKTMKKMEDEMEKMVIDLETPTSASVNVKLQADIDATIDEVLRKYSLEGVYTPEECVSPKEFKSKNTKHPKESRKKKEGKNRKDDKYESSEEVRRSDRIKTILPVKKKSHGLVRSKSEPALSAEAESSDSNSVHSELEKPIPVSPQLSKKNKAKSKAKSSENLPVTTAGPLLSENPPQLPKTVDLEIDKSGKAEIEARLKTFVHLKENQYKTDRQVCKEAREMICDCYLAEEDIKKDEYGCGEDCLNRLLMIECGYLCQIGDRCTNKRFQKGQFAPVEVFKTEKKGLGLIAAANIPYGEFILEYVGEVLNPDEFDKRAEGYSKDKNIHFYFMSLRADAIIDATMKGNISRFINHSCDPNAETQKWTVNGELRIGFFSTRTILAGEEITFDYKFQRYGKEAQKCYCGAASCRGWLGERPDESEDEDEEDEEEQSKVELSELPKAEIKIPSVDIPASQIDQKELILEKQLEKMGMGISAEVTAAGITVSQEVPATPQAEETPKKVSKKKARKELLFEDFDQLNEDIDMVVTTGLKNQAHTLKLSRLMVRAKDLEQRKKLLRVLRRGELPCRRLFLDYHGLRLMHGYMIDAQQLTNGGKKLNSSQLEFLQTKLELLQTLAVLPIQNKTMLIESKVLPAVKKWAKNEDLVEDDNDQKDVKRSPELNKQDVSHDPAVDEKIDEIKFLASKLLEEWVNLKESFRIPKKQRIEQMKEHEKEANRKFVETSYAQEKESSRKNDQRYRSWSRYKSERETNKKGFREDRPSAEYLKMSKHERRKLFALQMELKEEERRLKQREMWRQHEMNCMMIGADPRFTAPFDPNKGFQYIWNPSIGQWQALPVPSSQSQGVSGYNVPPNHKPNLLSHYTPPVLNVAGMTGPAQQYSVGMQQNIAPMVPGLSTSVITSTVAGITTPIAGIASLVPGMTGTLHGLSGSVPGITQPPLPALPLYPEVKQVEEDPSQVKFAGPIPPPVKLPPKWKCAKDKYSRPYYYHIKVRKSQWEPPPLHGEADQYSDTSSSETSSLSSSDSSSDCETDDEIDDTKLLMEVRKQMESSSKFSLKSVIPSHVKKEEKDSVTPSPEVKIDSDNEDESIAELKEETVEVEDPEQLTSIDIRLKEQFNLDSNDPPKKKRRIGLCQEIIISPRTEEDRQQFKEDLKRYKATKEKLKRQKDHMLHQSKKKLKTGSSADDSRKSRDKRLLKSTAKSRIKQMEWNDEHAKKIKEVFRSTMATTVVGVLNAYRKPDCKESRITNTDDFKHLARKLTHFVMLKEMKHISTIDELICTDNVKAKAREYIKKYMSKFGEVYQKRHDEPDFKD